MATSNPGASLTTLPGTVPDASVASTIARDSEVTTAVTNAKFVAIDPPVAVKTLTGLGDEDTWTDIDVTAETSASATSALINVFMLDSTSGDVFALHIRANGSSTAKSSLTARAKIQVTSQIAANTFIVPLDANQIFEYLFDREGGSGTLEFGEIQVLGYWV